MIYSSFQIYFCIKNQFPELFLYFYYTLDRATNSVEFRGPYASVPKTQNNIRKDGGFIFQKSEGSFTICHGRRGIGLPGSFDQHRIAQIVPSAYPNRYAILTVRSTIDGTSRDLTNALGFQSGGHRSSPVRCSFDLIWTGRS